MGDVADVRIAAATDLPAVAGSFGQEWFFRDRLVRQQLGHGELFIAWAGQTPVGNVYLWRERPYERAVREHLGWTPTINHLEVAVPWRNRGIGTALVRAAESHAAALGYGRIGLGVSIDNPAARRLYERLGYADWGHGLVESVWYETGDGGSQRQSLTCHWMARTLPTEAPAVDAWDAWTPDEVSRMLRGSTVDWCVAGGWALELWLGRQTREHGDIAGGRAGREGIEVAIDRRDFPAWRAQLGGFPLYANGGGRLWRLGDETDPPVRQVWLRDPVDPVWRMDTFLETRAGDRWVCHWLPAVRCPLSLAVARTEAGIPYLRPELVLLSRARHRRPKDETDLRVALPTLDTAARARLRDGLLAAPAVPDAPLGMDPGPHPWLTLLD